MSNSQWDEQKIALCEYGHCLWQLGFVAANDGNLSVRLPDGSILATPSGISKRLLTPEMLIHLDNQGNLLCPSPYRPTSELAMHLAFYAQRRDVCAVVHAHPPIATAFAVARRPIDTTILPESIMLLGDVPLCPYATPTTDEVVHSIAPYIQTADALLLCNHGAVTVGSNIAMAFARMETLEHTAKILWTAQSLGGAIPLNIQEQDKVIALRRKF